MTVAETTALVTAILAGLAAVLSALAAVVQAYRTQHAVDALGRGLNGRLDQLLAEREARMRAEHTAEVERMRLAALAGLVQVPRPEGRIEERPAAERAPGPERRESGE